MSPSGEQYDIAAEGYAATITEVGATLRDLNHLGRPLVVGFGPDEIRPAYRGAVLAPWPNRVADGHYSFDGRLNQLPLTEPARGNAIHGLAAWARFAVLSSGGGATMEWITLEHNLVPQSGYPFELHLQVTYALDSAGLTTTLAATNVGTTAAPYGCGPHPYLVAGDGHVNDWSLTLPASRYLEVTEDRLLPVAVKDVDQTMYDFRDGRAIGDAFLDHAFTSVAAGADGVARVRVTARDGGAVECSWDPSVQPWVQVHTADRPEPEQSRLGLAVEPMTCPPDAFNSGTDLVVLQPGDTHTAAWTIAMIEP